MTDTDTTLQAARAVIAATETGAPIPDHLAAEARRIITTVLATTTEAE